MSPISHFEPQWAFWSLLEAHSSICTTISVWTPIGALFFFKWAPMSLFEYQWTLLSPWGYFFQFVHHFCTQIGSLFFLIDLRWGLMSPSEQFLSPPENICSWVIVSRYLPSYFYDLWIPDRAWDETPLFISRIHKFILNNLWKILSRNKQSLNELVVSSSWKPC